ncbi:MAG: sigma-54-dependent Fis family transcriptional regulator [Betaproteobacteria bacterium]|nr:sigma-54-dependent Fis family transcriptional regulator [Betaproteobacteria bacterium]
MAIAAVNRRNDTSAVAAIRATVLVVDDEADIRELLEISLVQMGLSVDCAGNLADARLLLETGRYELCLTDMRLPDGDGLELVRFIGSNCVDVPVAVITAFGSTENAVAALKAGAFDYLTKPLSLAQLRTLIKSALNLPHRNTPARSEGQGLLGQSFPIEQVRMLVDKLARSQAPVYVTGESGSGKELAARLIHQNSSRRDKTFVPVNCGAIPENLMESEFFGYRKGAFTGADCDRDGFFQAANGGVLFLDEVADLPLGMQVKLLRAIQEKRVRKVGATSEDPVDVRLISATHQNLTKCVETGKFRQDLYYRLAVIELKMPPLRECREDIPILASAILARLTDSGQRVSLSENALSALIAYDFPGNTRELENVLERATALCSSNMIDPEDLQLEVPAAVADPAIHNEKWPLQEYLDKVEREVILEALEKTRFNRTAAAKILGVTFRSLRYRLERLDIR